MAPEAQPLLAEAQRLHAAGQREAAIELLRRAVAEHPELLPGYVNLAALLWEAGLASEAVAPLRRAVELEPRDASLWSRLAHVLAASGDARGALEAAAKAENAAPRDARTLAMLGGLHSEYGRWGDAARLFGQASRLDRGEPDVEVRLAHACLHEGDTQGAGEALARARQRAPDHLGAAVDEALLLPQVYEDLEDLARWRSRFAAGLHRLEAELPRWLARAEQVLELNHQNFLLAYQGEDDLALQRAYSRFLGALAARARPQWARPRPRRFDGGRRLRVGFAGAIFHDCTAGRYFERWITRLDGARFERFVYHLAPVSDGLTRRVAAASDTFVTLRRGADEALARMAADELDVLVHPEVGMTPFSLLAAAVRVAPVQVAAWGHPVTTGSDQIDAYLSCGPMEPADGASHYAEQLVGLPGPGVDYPMPPVAPQLARAAVGLPADAHVYACPQSLFKVHPAVDELVARICAADGRAVVAFFQAPSRTVTEQFARRVQRALERHGVPARGQVKFLPRLPGDAFRRALAACDVVIDTLHWSGGNTSLDAFAAGVPVVTLPGRFMRGRQTAGMLDLMGIGELIAGSADDYVRKAVEVAGDPGRNRALREAIGRQREALFDRPEPVAALADVLLRMAAGETPWSSILSARTQGSGAP